MSIENSPLLNDPDSWNKALQIQVEKRLKAESMIFQNKEDYNKYENDLKELKEFTSNWSLTAKNAVRNGEIPTIISYIDEIDRRVESAWTSRPIPSPPSSNKIEHEMRVAKFQGAATCLTEKTHQMGLKHIEKEEEETLTCHTSNINRIKDQTNVATLREDVFNLVQKKNKYESNPHVQFPAESKSGPMKSNSVPSAKRGLADFHSLYHHQDRGYSPYHNNEAGKTLLCPSLPKQIAIHHGREREHKSFVFEPNSHDVHCGRGYKIICKEGNTYFRNLVSALRYEYVASPRQDKRHFAELVHRHIRSLNPPGRFLDRESDEEPFIDIGIEKAIKKTSQALRENQPEILKKIASGELNVNVVKKSEVAYLIEERSRQVYAEVFPNKTRTSIIRDREPFLPSPCDMDRTKDYMPACVARANNSTRVQNKSTFTWPVSNENGSPVDHATNSDQKQHRKVTSLGSLPRSFCGNSKTDIHNDNENGNLVRRNSVCSISIELASSSDSGNSWKQKRQPIPISVRRMSYASIFSGMSDIDFECSDEEEKQCN